jgi:hypothetical protein
MSRREEALDQLSGKLSWESSVSDVKFSKQFSFIPPKNHDLHADLIGFLSLSTSWSITKLIQVGALADLIKINLATLKLLLLRHA